MSSLALKVLSPALDALLVAASKVGESIVVLICRSASENGSDCVLDFLQVHKTSAMDLLLQEGQSPEVTGGKVWTIWGCGQRYSAMSTVNR